MSNLPKTWYTVDFETYYSNEYTLRKLTNTAYIRDERFKIHGVGIKKNSWKQARWYSADRAEIALHAIDWSSVGLLAHHTHFDGFILSHHYGIKPAYYLDTLSMARPLHGGEIKNDLNSLAKYYGLGNKLPNILETLKGILNPTIEQLRKLGEYCKVDVELCEALFLCMLPQYPDHELDLIHHTISLFTNPIAIVDKKIAKAEHTKEIQRRESLIASLPYTAKEIKSRNQFPSILREAGVEPPTKISPRTGKETWAFAKTDSKWIALREHPDETVRTLVEARNLLSSNINETRALRLLEHSTPSLPIYLNYGKAHTLRWTGRDKMNPQNFPRESLLRNAILAPRGHRFVIVDSSQIEARVNAWLAGEVSLIEAFRENRDIYSEFAGEKIYKRTITKRNKTERFIGKVCILGLGYQMGASKFKHTLNVGAMGPPIFLDDEMMYEDIVATYRQTYPYIRQQWFTMGRLLDFIRTCSNDQWEEYGPLQFEKGKILLPNDMYLRYPRLRIKKAETEKEWDQTIYNENSKIYGGLLTENIVQALARIIVAEQILKVAWKYRVVLMVHDEVILCVPTRQAKRALEETLAAFKTPPIWAPNLPVTGEGGITTYYQKL